jgi:hypothetical protein
MTRFDEKRQRDERWKMSREGGERSEATRTEYGEGLVVVLVSVEAIGSGRLFCPKKEEHVLKQASQRTIKPYEEEVEEKQKLERHKDHQSAAEFYEPALADA